MKVVGFLSILFLLTTQSYAFTGTFQEYRGAKELSDLPGMAIDGPKYMVGAYEEKGVKGVASLNDLRAEMRKYGLRKTHHLMVEFKEIASGELIEVGAVAVKAISPDGKISRSTQLLHMEGGFGADIALNNVGEYHFKVATKLKDGKQRTFHFSFAVK